MRALSVEWKEEALEPSTHSQFQPPSSCWCSRSQSTSCSSSSSLPTPSWGTRARVACRISGAEPRRSRSTCQPQGGGGEEPVGKSSGDHRRSSASCHVPNGRRPWAETTPTGGSMEAPQTKELPHRTYHPGEGVEW